MSESLSEFRAEDQAAARRRYLIENLLRQGYGTNEIVRRTGIPKRKVRFFVAKYRNEERREALCVEAHRRLCLHDLRELPAELLRHRSIEAMRRVRAYGGEADELVDLAAVIEHDAAICHICGEAVEPDELAFDHVIPLVLGGAHAVHNVRIAHSRCNGEQGARL